MAPWLVGLAGVEPATSPLSGVRSNQLSYRPGAGPGLRGRGVRMTCVGASPTLWLRRVL